MKATPRRDDELNATVAEHFDRCLGCMACLTVVPVGRPVRPADRGDARRVEKEVPRPLGDRLLRARGLRRLPAPAAAPRRRSASSRRSGAGPARSACAPLAELAPRPPLGRVAAGADARAGRATVGLLTGCVQCVAFGEVNRPRHACSPPTATRSRARGAAAAARSRCTPAARAEGSSCAPRRSPRSSGCDSIVTNAAGCGSHLKDYGDLLADDPAWAERADAFSAKVLDVSELLGEPGRAPSARAARRLPGVVPPRPRAARPRRAARAARPIPGLEPVEPEEQELCCGSAGDLQPRPARGRPASSATARPASARDRAEALVSANPGCLLQVSAALRRAGRPLPADHPVELLDASIRGLGPEDLLKEART